jgi:hypothetical protein
MQSSAATDCAVCVCVCVLWGQKGQVIDSPYCHLCLSHPSEGERSNYVGL